VNEVFLSFLNRFSCDVKFYDASKLQYNLEEEYYDLDVNEESQATEVM